ncbi:MAG: hypothetical protein KQI81_08975 [Deltaproteobacteria bacterium]|nr:hypothetical protein [Deltaproteobacteria bacterium]
MASSDASLFGIAKQTALGTPNTTDASFKYLLFNRGGIGPNNVVVPLDNEIGGGAITRDVVKMGVYSGGSLELIPRPETLGWFLLGAFGAVATTGAGPSYDHTFKLGTNQFDAPYFTVRSSPGGLWGEQFQDMRVASIGLQFAGSDFVRSQVGFMGGLPARIATAAWNASSYLDGGPQFIASAADTKIELPTASQLKVLAGSFTAGMAIPLNEQWVLGSYSPDAFDITRRAFGVNFTVKVTDSLLYSKMAYGSDGAAVAWAADVFKEAAFAISLSSAVSPFKLVISGNGSNEASGAANVAWSVQPIGLRSGGNVVMNVSGVFLADGENTCQAVLTNETASYA